MQEEKYEEIQEKEENTRGNEQVIKDKDDVRLEKEHIT